MSGHVDIGASSSSQLGTEFITLQFIVTFLMLGTVMGTLLIAILIALFTFSVPSTRRRPLFILNVCSTILGIALAFLNGYIEIHNLLSPSEPLSPHYDMSYAVLTAITPILVESILLMRLMAVFQWRSTSKHCWIAVMAFPILVKIARIVNMGLFEAKSSREPSAAAAQALLLTTPNIKIEWFLQIFDNTYSSSIFLWKMSTHQKHSQSSGQVRTRGFCGALSALLWISVSNFVFPVMLSIVQLVVFMATPNVELALYIQEVNFYVAIIGVVFATVWATGSAWADAHSLKPSDRSSALDMRTYYGRHSQGTMNAASMTQLTSSGEYAAQPSRWSKMQSHAVVQVDIAHPGEIHIPTTSRSKNFTDV